MWQNKQLFDLSNYEKDHAIFDDTIKKVLGKMKAECGGAVIKLTLLVSLELPR